MASGYQPAIVSPGKPEPSRGWEASGLVLIVHFPFSPAPRPREMEDQSHGALAVKQTPEQVEALAEAVWYLLDDMGKDGTSVCRYKAKARIAYEPFREADHTGDDGVDMPLAEAEALVRDTDEGL